MFQIVFCFCHILFSHPNQYSQSACRFYVPQLVYLFFFLNFFFPWASRAVFSLLPIKYVCLRVAEVIIGHSEELCKLITGLVTWSCCFSLLAGQIGNSPKSLSSGFFFVVIFPGTLNFFLLCISTSV